MTKGKKSKKTKKRTYTMEQKIQAVKIARASKTKTKAQVARELGISENTLWNWINRDKIDLGEKPISKPKRKKMKTKRMKTPVATGERTSYKELAEIKRENKRLLVERDFLKKAVAFFALEDILEESAD
jgi:transposase